MSDLTPMLRDPMTMTTRLRIADPLPAADVIGEAVRLIGSPDGRDGRDGFTYWNVPADGPVLLWITWAPDPEAAFVVAFDTSYGWRGPKGEGYAELHRELTGRLGQWVEDRGSDWSVYDEFHRRWMCRTPGPP